MKIKKMTGEILFKEELQGWSVSLYQPNRPLNYQFDFLFLCGDLHLAIRRIDADKKYKDLPKKFEFIGVFLNEN